MIEEHGLPRTEVNSACRKMDLYMEYSMEVMSNLSNIYLQNKHFEKGAKIVNEMEELEEEFHSAYKTVWESMNSWKCSTSNVKSTDPLQRTCSREESMSESFQKKD